MRPLRRKRIRCKRKSVGGRRTCDAGAHEYAEKGKSVDEEAPLKKGIGWRRARRKADAQAVDASEANPAHARVRAIGWLRHKRLDVP